MYNSFSSASWLCQLAEWRCIDILRLLVRTEMVRKAVLPM
jgi:hypothetical protein